MIRKVWDRLSLTMKVTFSLSAWVFLFVLIHGSFTFRANHQKAFAQAVAKRIGIPSIKVSAKSDVLIFEGSATREQSEFAEKIGQYYIMKFGPKAINPPTEIRNSLQIREPAPTRQMKQASRVPRVAPTHSPVQAARPAIAYRGVQSYPRHKQSFAATLRRVSQSKPRTVAHVGQRKYKYSEVISQIALKKRVLAGAPRPSELQRR